MTAKERETHIRLEVDIAVPDSWTGETKFLLELLDVERERVKKLEDAIRWALGEGDSDFHKHEPEHPGWSRWWWRMVLRRKAGLT